MEGMRDERLGGWRGMRRCLDERPGWGFRCGIFTYARDKVAELAVPLAPPGPAAVKVKP